MGDLAGLIERKESILKSIDAILTLDAKNALVPHGVGGMARQLFVEIVSWAERAAAALKAAEATIAEQDFLLNEGGTWEAQLRKAEADLAAARAEIERLREGLRRQGDNMAFVLNHAELYQWAEKFDRELAEDRALLAGKETEHG